MKKLGLILVLVGMFSGLSVSYACDCGKLVAFVSSDDDQSNKPSPKEEDKEPTS